MLYIKFKEWDIKSLKIACREAERLGYIESEWVIDENIWSSTLLLRHWEYYISFYWKNELIRKWYKEHKINPLRKLYYYLTT